MSKETVKRKHNFYSTEFKQSAVQLVYDSGKSVVQIARDLGVNDNTLHTWVSKSISLNSNSKNNNMSKNNSNEFHFDEIKKLRKELTIVKQERDLLKKAAAYFAKISQ